MTFSNRSIHILVYVKHQLGSGRGAPQLVGNFAEESLFRPAGHGFGQRWLFDLASNGCNVVVWLFSVIRYKDVCLPPSLDARIHVARAFSRDASPSGSHYINWLLSNYRYAFEADPRRSFYLPWNNATAVLRKIFPDIAFHGNESAVMPFCNFSTVMTRFQTPRRINPRDAEHLESFAETVIGMTEGFISYRRKDAPLLAMQTAARMYHHDIAPWWDQWAMPRKVAEEDAMLSSAAMAKALENAIARSKLAVSLHTPDYTSNRSLWTMLELETIERASRNGQLTHIPIKAGCQNPSDAESFKKLVDHELRKAMARQHTHDDSGGEQE